MLVGLMMDVEDKNLEKILKILPCLKSPTVSNLGKKNWFDVFVVTDDKTTRELIPRLKEEGANDIIEFPLGKMIE